MAGSDNFILCSYGGKNSNSEEDIQEGGFLFLMGVITEKNDSWNSNHKCSERKKVKEVTGIFVNLKILDPNGCPSLQIYINK